jgi:quercetin dioxygenase-like cupin family protein
MGLVEIDAGASNPLHFHPNCDEALHLLEGQLDHRVGERVVSMTVGDTIHVPVRVPHQATNTGSSTARMVIAYNTGRREMVVVET